MTKHARRASGEDERGSCQPDGVRYARPRYSVALIALDFRQLPSGKDREQRREPAEAVDHVHIAALAPQSAPDLDELLRPDPIANVRRLSVRYQAGRCAAARMCDERDVVTTADQFAHQDIDDALDAPVVHGRHGDVRIRSD
jgi:hypothetical protein